MRPHLLRPGIQTPLALTVLDEGVLSVFSLGLNFALIRMWPPAFFGAFIFILSLGLLFYSLQSSLFTTQLAVLRPRAREEGKEQELLATLWTGNIALTGALAIATLMGAALLAQGLPRFLPLAAALFVAGALLREYVRSLVFSEFRPGLALATDLAYVAIAGASLAVLNGQNNLQIDQVLLVLAGASFTAGVPVMLVRRVCFCLRCDRAVRTRYGAIWRNQSRWAVAGAVMHEAMDRAHVFVVATFFGAAAVGILQAGEMLFRPLGLLLQAWERIAKPAFAKLAAARDVASARLMMVASLTSGVVGAAVLFVALWAAWPLIEDHLYGRKYGGIGWIVMLWGVAAVLRLASQVLNVELQGFARFGELSAVSAAASLSVLLLLAITTLGGNYPLSILAIAAGHLVAFVLMAAIIARFYRAMAADVISASAVAYLPPWLPMRRAPAPVALKSARG
jgi:O-antigen/teichoic acid export membrane protein